MKSFFPTLQRMVISCLFILASALLFSCCDGTISPEDRTYTSVVRLRTAINSFVAANGRAPLNLGELARYEPAVSTLKDGWNNPLVYQLESFGVASITSLGKDNKPGGSGRNADSVWSFALKDQSGNWIGTNWQKGSLDWLTNAARPIRQIDPSKPK